MRRYVHIFWYVRLLWFARYAPSSPMLRGLAGHVRSVQLLRAQFRPPRQTCSVLPWPRSPVRIPDKENEYHWHDKKKGQIATRSFPNILLILGRSLVPLRRRNCAWFALKGFQIWKVRWSHTKPRHNNLPSPEHTLLDLEDIWLVRHRYTVLVH